MYITDLANKLLEDIRTEYQNRLDSGKTKEQSVAFDNQLFIEKYHYDANTLTLALDELNDYGYIVKWIVSGFEFVVD